MTRTSLLVLTVMLTSCTDIGVIGLRAPTNTGGAGGSSTPAAAGSGGTLVCPFGVCNLPPLCRSPEPLCILCNNHSDCTRDPAEPFCSPVFGTCVECLSDADCGPAEPHCEGGECDFCKDDDQCPDGQRCNDGTCEPD